MSPVGHQSVSQPFSQLQAPATWDERALTVLAARNESLMSEMRSSEVAGSVCGTPRPSAEAKH